MGRNVPGSTLAEAMPLCIQREHRHSPCFRPNAQKKIIRGQLLSIYFTDKLPMAMAQNSVMKKDKSPGRGVFWKKVTRNELQAAR
mmetsp:Transcript_10545/g.20627  ORF Transcript_10545/g.20627 Transcript_10545/m.20627 type:complete len:85 (+) Transcript_10545:886-1140(+)